MSHGKFPRRRPYRATTQTAFSEPAREKQDRVYHTVADAALHWGDPELNAELCRLSNLGYNDQTLAAIFGTETPADRRADRYCRILDDLRCDLIEKLCTETLVAIGFTAASSPSSDRERIHPGRWRVLVPDYDNNSATGGGLNLLDILVTDASRHSAISADRRSDLAIARRPATPSRGRRTDIVP